MNEFANPYVSSIVGFFLNIDKSMTWGHNFRDYGAKERSRITAEEIFVSISLYHLYCTFMLQSRQAETFSANILPIYAKRVATRPKTY